jgi:type II secretory pathway component GspD/PulD (secretin)
MKNLFRTTAFFILLLAGLAPVTAAAPAPLPDMENKTLSMDLQNANLKDVLKIFSIQSGLNFIAAQNVEDRKITLFLDKVPIREGMTKLFEANNLTYEFDENANIYVVKYWGEPQVEVLTKIYKLKNRSVSTASVEVEKTTLMASAGVTTQASGTAANASGDTGLRETVKQVLSKEGKITEDKRTNSLIITDIPSRFPVIDELIARLDVPQPMVLLEVEMLDVNKSTMDNLGFDFGDNPVNIAFNKGFSFNDITASVTGMGGNGLSFGRGQDFRYSSVLDFLRTQQDVKFLARPKILTMNNETAEIGITKDQIMSVKQTTSQPSGGGSSTTTVEFDRATDLKLTPEGIGIYLRVTPQVNMETGEITMVVNPKSSSAERNLDLPNADEAGNITLAYDPEIRMTKSIIKVKDGETIAIGGLIHKENSTKVRKMPILGDVPVLGALFRHKETTKDVDRELVVFITPRILKDNADMFAKADTQSTYALQYLSSGSKRKQQVDNLLDAYEEK